MTSSTQRQRFARAVLDELGRRQPDLGRAMQVRALAPSEGAAGHLWRVALPGRIAVLKVRADPAHGVEREAWALRRLGGRGAPALLAAARLQALIERAVRRRDLTAARALDAGTGDLLLLGWCAGRLAGPDASDAHLDAVARAVASLHARRPRSGPHSPIPSSPHALLALAQDQLRVVRARDLLAAPAVAAAQRAVRAARQHLERAARRLDWQRVRTLCHGDLRWHNILLDEDRAWLIDLEHAGLGDPAVDLALMACRTPLSPHDELRLLDAYLAAARSRSLLDRYFALKPLLGVVAALAGVLDLGDLCDGARSAVADPVAWARARAPLIADELGDACERALGQRCPPAGLRLRPLPRPARRLPGPVAIDGPAASLCSPLAALLARSLGWAHVDTGVLYRFAALLAWVRGLSPERAIQRAELVRVLRQSGARAAADGALVVDGQHLSRVLRTVPVERQVAGWAACPEVRAAVGDLLRPWLRCRRAVIEGRDVGSVLLPAAPLKLFVDGPLVERAARYAGRGSASTPQARVRLARRDRLDRERGVAPLLLAPGALRLRVRDDRLDVTVRRVRRWLEATPC